MSGIRGVLMGHWMFNCKAVSEKVCESMDRDIAVHERMMMRMHLLMCKYCARFWKQMKFLRQAVQFGEVPDSELDDSVALSKDARTRLKQSLQNHCGKPE